MWKCSNCGEICTSDYCDRCGLPKEESVFDEIEEDVLYEEMSENEITDVEEDVPVIEENEFEDEYVDDFDEGDYYVEDAYAEPDELIESKRSKTKKEVKAEEKREKRVAELENKLKEEKTNQQQVPMMYKYEVKLKQMKKICTFVVVAVVAVCAALVVVFGLGSGSKSLQIEKMNEEDIVQNERITALEKENASIKTQLSSLEAENDVLRELRASVRVLESDGTYHMYGCDEIDSDIIWIYGKEQVVDNSRYDKCEKCNF